MSMFCFQCQETAKSTGCTKIGVCGKNESTSNLQDLLIFVLKGIAIYDLKLKEKGVREPKVGPFLMESLFATITNVNFDDDRILSMIHQGFRLRDELKTKYLSSQSGSSKGISDHWHEAATWLAQSEKDLEKKSFEIGILKTENPDVRSLRELLTIGLKGLCAYAHHAYVLGYHDQKIYDFISESLVSTTIDLTVPEMIEMVMKCGEFAVKTMALLDQANTSTYGNPEITKVHIGAGNHPGILISGHDLKDMEQLLKQTEGTGVDVYTHGEMLPANYYPAFKKYKHLVGNYGSSWWNQDKEFESFHGPILMTTNCLIPVKDSYKNRIFTTGTVGFPGVKHIPEGQNGRPKDFSEIIALAKKCPAPKSIETGEIIGGFAHHQVLSLADKVVAAVKSGAIKRFVVMGGCDGRFKDRDYFTQVAQALPKDTIILTAGCAKFRYNKLALGDIGGIPRVLDAGQCNDCYSLAVIALKLKEVFGLKDINDLPLSFDIAWYEQKAVTVLLALLYLGIKGIRLGPTLPAFLSPNVAKVLVENFQIKLIDNVEKDVEAIMAGR